MSLFNDQVTSKTDNISFTLGTQGGQSMVIKLNEEVLELFEMNSGEFTNHSYSLQLKLGQNILKFEIMGLVIAPGEADNRKLALNIGEFVYD
ncbi:hypothetical protein OAB52_02385 [Candidatus Thioglobus sp.]|nr:hypothetical protein [Candidatus Thioglobus sp.]